MKRARTRRITRRAFVRQASLLALALPNSIGLLTGLAARWPPPRPGRPAATPMPVEAPRSTGPPTSTATPPASGQATPADGQPSRRPPRPHDAFSHADAGRHRDILPDDGPIPTLPPAATRETVLTTLRLSHPRLMLLADDEARIRRALTSDVSARSFRDALLRNGSRVITQPTPERVLIGPRLLTVSRTVLDRVMTLALLYRLDGDRRWVARAREELLAAAAFTDWNPPHFLDVAEMSHAFAIGYDWLYDALTPDDRTTIRRALVEKGLRPAEEEYTNRAGWTRATHNWNLVCNGAVIMSALAIADEEPGLAGTLVAQALAPCPRPSPPTRRTAPGRKARPTGSTAPSTSSRRWPP